MAPMVLAFICCVGGCCSIGGATNRLMYSVCLKTEFYQYLFGFLYRTTSTFVAVFCFNRRAFIGQHIALNSKFQQHQYSIIKQRRMIERTNGDVQKKPMRTCRVTAHMRRPKTSNFCVCVLFAYIWCPFIPRWSIYTAARHHNNQAETQPKPKTITYR